MFTRKAVVDKIFIKNSSNICKSIVGIDASQLYPSQCVKICQQDCTQDVSLTLICRSLKLDITDLATLRILSCIFTRNKDQNVKLRVFSHQENRKKTDCFIVDGYCNHCKTVFEAMGCYYHFCSCQEARPFLT